MVDTVGTIGSAVSASAARVAAASPATSTATSATAKVAAQPISPVSVVDALSGVVITEYLDNGGHVTEQTPSTAAVAYRRIGLSPNGFREDQATQPVTA